MFHKWKKIRQRLIHIAKALCMHAYNLCLSVLSGELPLLQCRHSSLMCPERWVSLASLPLTCHQCVLRVEFPLFPLLHSPRPVTNVSCMLSFPCFTAPDLSPMCPASWAFFASLPLTCHLCVLRVELYLLHSPWVVTNVSCVLSFICFTAPDLSPMCPACWALFASQPLTCHLCVLRVELYLLHSPWLVTSVSCVLSFPCFTAPDSSPTCPERWVPLLHSPWFVINVSRALSFSKTRFAVTASSVAMPVKAIRTNAESRASALVFKVYRK